MLPPWSLDHSLSPSPVSFRCLASLLPLLHPTVSGSMCMRHMHNRQEMGSLCLRTCADHFDTFCQTVPHRRGTHLASSTLALILTGTLGKTGHPITLPSIRMAHFQNLLESDSLTPACSGQQDIYHLGMFCSKLGVWQTAKTQGGNSLWNTGPLS